MNPTAQDVIAAQATAQGRGGVAIIRISGPGCFAICDLMTRPKISSSPPRVMTYGQIFNRKSLALDHCLTVRFEGPKSFTGEDLVEFHCHGSPYVCQEILRTLFDFGARPAEPGEFTRRAYENGKISLIEAEAIGVLVAAESADQWECANEMAEGHLEKRLVQIKKDALHVLAQLESRIEFPDEGDVEDFLPREILTEIDKFKVNLAELVSTYESGKVAHDGLSVVLLGPPNAGKSTLLNHLTRSSRAIVTEIPGTTRDYLEEVTLIRGHLFRFIDTAGIRTSEDRVEREGIDRSHKKAMEADLVLLLIPSDICNEEWEVFKIPLLRSTSIKPGSYKQNRIYLRVPVNQASEASRD